MHRSFLALALVGAFVAGGIGLVACGDDETTAAPPGPIKVENLAGEFEKADCEAKVRCTVMPDLATCTDVDGADYTLLQLIADVTSGKVTYDEQGGRDWVEAIRKAPCQSTLAVAKSIEAAYKKAFAGTVAVGGACFVDGECVDFGLCDRAACQGGPACCVGVCTPAPAQVEEGGDCSMGTCVDSAFCGGPEDPDGEGGAPPTGGATCQPRADNGQDCDDTFGCQDAQRCGNGKCYKLSPSGQPCNPNLQVSCIDFSNWCEPTEGKCVALPPAGQPCGSNGAQCALYAFCDGGTCQPKPSVGEACDDQGQPCIGDLRCQDDTCQKRSLQVCVGDGEQPQPGTGGAGGGG
jgi:hypothetical protein